MFELELLLSSELESLQGHHIVVYCAKKSGYLCRKLFKVLTIGGSKMSAGLVEKGNSFRLPKVAKD